MFGRKNPLRILFLVGKNFNLHRADPLVNIFHLDDRPQLVEQYRERFPHGNPADDQKSVCQELDEKRGPQVGHQLTGNQGDCKTRQADDETDPPYLNWLRKFRSVARTRYWK